MDAEEIKDSVPKVRSPIRDLIPNPSSQVLDPNQFIWTRVSDDSDADDIWNIDHYGGTKQIEITNEDVQVRATFYCDLIDTTTRQSLLGKEEE